MEHNAASSTPALLKALALILALVAFSILARTLYKNRDRYRLVDFSEYYAWSSELRSGGDPWLPLSLQPSRPSTIFHLGNCNNTPTYLALFSPLTRLEPRPAYWLWQTLLVISLIAATLLAVRELMPSAGFSGQGLAVSAILLFPHVYGTLYEAQPTFLILLMLVGAWVFDRRECPVAAGFMLALATLIKMYPGAIGGYFLLRRRWRTVGYAIGFALIGLVLSNPRYQFELFRYGVPISQQPMWLMQDRSIAILPNAYFLLTKLAGHAPAYFAYLMTALLLDIPVLGAAIQATLESPRTREFDGFCLGLWMTAALLVSPMAWAHELVLTIVLWLAAIALLIRGANWRNLGTAVLMLGLIGALAPYFSSPIRSAHLYFWATVAIYVGGYLTVRRWKRPLLHSEPRIASAAGFR